MQKHGGWSQNTVRITWAFPLLVFFLTILGSLPALAITPDQQAALEAKAAADRPLADQAAQDMSTFIYTNLGSGQQGEQQAGRPLRRQRAAQDSGRDRRRHGKDPMYKL